MAIKIYQLYIISLLSFFILFVSAKKELKLLHVLSTNKFYVPGYNDSSSVFKAPSNLTYEYFTENAMDVPNSIKMDLFNLGVHLRESYGNFLSSLYMDEITKMKTTEIPVSIIGGELINAGLWPPVEPQIWNKDLAWQPIPFEYTAVEEDTVLLGTLCPNFKIETTKVLKNYNLNTAQAELLNYINEVGKIKVENLLEVPLLYFALENSMALNQTLPEWTNKIFPGKELLNATLTAYELLSMTKTQKRLNGGSFIKTILQNSEDYINGRMSRERQINIYSGDDRIFAGVLKNLNIPQYDIQTPGAALIFELYAEDQDHFIKIVYHTGASNETLPYTLIGCDLFCPIEKFSEIVADVLPDNELTLCNSVSNSSSTEETGAGGGSSSISQSKSLSVILCLIVMTTTTKIVF